MSALVVLASIAGRPVAIDTASVQSVVDLESIVSVPRTPDHVAGIAALRSRALTVIDMHVVVGASRLETVANRAIVVECDDHAYALLVENVSDVVRTTGDVQPIPGHLSRQWNRITAGLVETSAGPAILIDSRALLGDNPAQAA